MPRGNTLLLQEAEIYKRHRNAGNIMAIVRAMISDDHFEMLPIRVKSIYTDAERVGNSSYMKRIKNRMRGLRKKFPNVVREVEDTRNVLHTNTAVSSDNASGQLSNGDGGETSLHVDSDRGSQDGSVDRGESETEQATESTQPVGERVGDRSETQTDDQSASQGRPVRPLPTQRHIMQSMLQTMDELRTAIQESNRTEDVIRRFLRAAASDRGWDLNSFGSDRDKRRIKCIFKRKHTHKKTNQSMGTLNK